MGYDIGPRTFDGEKFQIADTFTKKVDAKKKADVLRKQGYKSRVVFYLGPHIYATYRGPRT